MRGLPGLVGIARVEYGEPCSPAGCHNFMLGPSVPIARWRQEPGAGRQVTEAWRAAGMGIEAGLDEQRIADVPDMDGLSGRRQAGLTWRLLGLGRWARWVQTLASTGALAA